MPNEGITYDRKALAAVTDSKPDWNALAKDVVAFAGRAGSSLLQEQFADIDMGELQTLPSNPCPRVTTISILINRQ